jgi:hypothetical protein
MPLSVQGSGQRESVEPTRTSGGRFDPSPHHLGLAASGFANSLSSSVLGNSIRVTSSCM